MNELINFDECLKKGLLRKIDPSNEKAFACLSKAINLAKEAKEDLEYGQINSAVIVGYTALFDAARTVLFRDGYREKSHTCVTRYLEAKYSGAISRDIIMLLDRYRTIRHDTQCDVTYFPTTEEAAELVNFTEAFIEKVKALINYSETK